MNARIIFARSSIELLLLLLVLCISVPMGPAIEKKKRGVSLFRIYVAHTDKKGLFVTITCCCCRPPFLIEPPGTMLRIGRRPLNGLTFLFLFFVFRGVVTQFKYIAALHCFFSYFFFSSFLLFFLSHPRLLAYCYFTFSHSYMDALKPLSILFFLLPCQPSTFIWLLVSSL